MQTVEEQHNDARTRWKAEWDSRLSGQLNGREYGVGLLADAVLGDDVGELAEWWFGEWVVRE